jgi:chromosome segregation ATPase
VEKLAAAHADELDRRDEHQAQRVEELVAERQADQHNRFGDLQIQIGDLQSQLVCAMAEQAQTAALQSKTAVALEESQRERARLEALLTELMAHQSRVTAAMEAQRVRAEQAEQTLADTATDRNDLAKSIADLQVELQHVDARLRGLEPLAAGGRLARDLGSELSATVAAIDGRARHLLAHSTLDAAYRREVETLRAETLAALSLARQITLRKTHEAAED